LSFCFVSATHWGTPWEKETETEAKFSHW